MKYMLLIYNVENSLTEETREQCMAEGTRVCHELAAQGNFIDAAPLQPVAMSTCVTVKSGTRVVTDGPFVETTEQLGGYFLIEADNLDEAIAIAGRLPPAKYGTVEIRPVVELPNMPTAGLHAAAAS